MLQGLLRWSLSAAAVAALAACSGSGGSEALLEAVLAQVASHPFAQEDPAMARQVGEFRIRLLDL